MAPPGFFSPQHHIKHHHPEGNNAMFKASLAVIAALTITTITTMPVAAQSGDGPALAAKIQKLEDQLAVLETQYCYGRAQDVIYRNYASEAKSKGDGLAAFQKCFTDNANISISLLGGDILQDTNALPDWVNFVYNFGQSNKYLSTRHLISNVEIKFEDADTATVYSSGVNPHFIKGSDKGNEPAIDWIIGNYLSTVKRTDKGWKIAKMRINGDEFARTPGFYPFGQTNGSGNIGFKDNY
jgi:hypothetical protein